MLLALSLGQPASAHPGASATIDHYSHEIERDPKNQRLYLLRGIAYSNDGRYDEALADFKQAEKLGEPVLVSCDLGVLHYRKAEFEAAVGYLDRYLERYPARGREYCLEYRARARRDSGDHAGSILDFRRVIELEPRPNPGHYVSVATMLAESGESGIDEALAILDAGIAKLGLNPQLQHHAIELELTRQRPDRALARGEALRPILGESPEWKVDMAELYLRNGEKTQANRMLKDAKTQVQSLRKTPARLRLRERITELEGRSALPGRSFRSIPTTSFGSSSTPFPRNHGPMASSPGIAESTELAVAPLIYHLPSGYWSGGIAKQTGDFSSLPKRQVTVGISGRDSPGTSTSTAVTP
jgi:DNA-binding SARP family transcriptional activator